MHVYNFLSIEYDFEVAWYYIYNSNSQRVFKGLKLNYTQSHQVS